MGNVDLQACFEALEVPVHRPLHGHGSNMNPFQPPALHRLGSNRSALPKFVTIIGYEPPLHWWHRFPDFIPVRCLQPNGCNARHGATVHIDFLNQFQNSAPEPGQEPVQPLKRKSRSQWVKQDGKEGYKLPCGRNFSRGQKAIRQCITDTGQLHDWHLKPSEERMKTVPSKKEQKLTWDDVRKARDHRNVQQSDGCSDDRRDQPTAIRRGYVGTTGAWRNINIDSPAWLGNCSLDEDSEL